MAEDALSRLRGQDAAVRSHDRVDDGLDAVSAGRGAARDGALLLAIFQVPNKFFEADGRVVDAAGQDWDEAWGHKT